MVSLDQKAEQPMSSTYSMKRVKAAIQMANTR